MKNTWLMAVVALLVLSAAGCKKDNKAEQLAALDNAYQSGVFSKSEYEAKRLALMGPAGAPVAAPVAAAPANPVAPPPASADTPLAPAVAVEPSATPAPPPAAPARLAPAPHKAAPVVTRSQAATERPVPAQAMPAERTPVTPNVGQPPPLTQPAAAAPAQTPAPLAAQTRPAPKTSAGEAESEPQPLAGCEDAEYQSGTVKGARQRFYPAPMDSVKRAAGAALRSLDFTIQKEGGNEMEASKRRHISAIVGAGGERLMLRFEKAQQGNQAGTLVTGETKKSFVGRVSQKSWTNAVLAQIACHLRARR